MKLKSKLLATLACLTVAAAGTTLIACDSDAGGGHSHTYSTEWSNDGVNHWHSATCEHTDEISDLAAHDWGTPEVITPATEEAEGSQKIKCEICSYEKTEKIDKLAHTHKYSTDWSSDGDNHWHAPTCGHDAENRDIAAHDWGTPEVITPATEETEGSQKVKCEICGYEKTEKIDKLAHTHKYSTDWSSDGDNHWHAPTCGHDVGNRDIAPHDWVGAEIIKSPDCTTDGEQKFTCKYCGKEKTEIIARLGHNYELSEVTSIPSDTDEGAAVKTCSVCGDTQSVILPVLSDDGYTISDDTATCAQAGEITYGIKIDGVNISFNVVSPKKEHNAQWQVTKSPLANSAGTVKKICDDCGEELDSFTVGLLGQANVDNGFYTKEVVKAATCLEEGLETYTTVLEKYPKLTEPITFELQTDKLPHTNEVSKSVIEGQNFVVLKCSVCGHESDAAQYDAEIQGTGATASEAVEVSSKTYFVEAKKTVTAYKTVALTAGSYTISVKALDGDQAYLNQVGVGSLSRSQCLYANGASNNGGSLNSTYAPYIELICENSRVTGVKINADNDTFRDKVLYFTLRNSDSKLTAPKYILDITEQAAPGTLSVGDNTVSISEAYLVASASTDTYSFTAPTTGKYTMTVPDGVNVARGSGESAVTFIDSFDSNWAVFDATAGSPISFTFTGDAEGDFTVKIEEGGKEESYVLGLDAPLSGVAFNDSNSFTAEITVGETVAEGTYKLKIGPFTRNILTVTVGENTYYYQPGCSLSHDNCEESGGYISYTVTLKAGDVIKVVGQRGTTFYMNIQLEAVEAEQA